MSRSSRSPDSSYEGGNHVQRSDRSPSDATSTSQHPAQDESRHAMRNLRIDIPPTPKLDIGTLTTEQRGRTRQHRHRDPTGAQDERPLVMSGKAQPAALADTSQIEVSAPTPTTAIRSGTSNTLSPTSGLAGHSPSTDFSRPSPLSEVHQKISSQALLYGNASTYLPNTSELHTSLMVPSPGTSHVKRGVPGVEGLRQRFPQDLNRAPLPTESLGLDRDDRGRRNADGQNDSPHDKRGDWKRLIPFAGGRKRHAKKGARGGGELSSEGDAHPLHSEEMHNMVSQGREGGAADGAPGAAAPSYEARTPLTRGETDPPTTPSTSDMTGSNRGGAHGHHSSSTGGTERRGNSRSDGTTVTIKSPPTTLNPDARGGRTFSSPSTPSLSPHLQPAPLPETMLDDSGNHTTGDLDDVIRGASKVHGVRLTWLMYLIIAIVLIMFALVIVQVSVSTNTTLTRSSSELSQETASQTENQIQATIVNLNVLFYSVERLYNISQTNITDLALLTLKQSVCAQVFSSPLAFGVYAPDGSMKWGISCYDDDSYFDSDSDSYYDANRNGGGGGLNQNGGSSSATGSYGGRSSIETDDMFRVARSVSDQKPGNLPGEYWENESVQAGFVRLFASDDMSFALFAYMDSLNYRFPNLTFLCVLNKITMGDIFLSNALPQYSSSSLRRSITAILLKSNKSDALVVALHSLTMDLSSYDEPQPTALGSSMLSLYDTVCQGGRAYTWHVVQYGYITTEFYDPGWKTVKFANTTYNGMPKAYMDYSGVWGYLKQVAMCGVVCVGTEDETHCSPNNPTNIVFVFAADTLTSDIESLVGVVGAVSITAFVLFVCMAVITYLSVSVPIHYLNWLIRITVASNKQMTRKERLMYKLTRYFWIGDLKALTRTFSILSVCFRLNKKYVPLHVLHQQAVDLKKSVNYVWKLMEENTDDKNGTTTQNEDSDDDMGFDPELGEVSAFVSTVAHDTRIGRAQSVMQMSPGSGMRGAGGDDRRGTEMRRLAASQRVGGSSIGLESGTDRHSNNPDVVDFDYTQSDPSPRGGGGGGGGGGFLHGQASVGGAMTVVESATTLSIHICAVELAYMTNFYLSTKQHRRIMNTILSKIRQFRGEVFLRSGDQIAAAWNAFDARSDHAERATLCALDIARAFSNYRREGLRMGIVLHQGSFVCGVIEDSTEAFTTVFGNVPQQGIQLAELASSLPFFNVLATETVKQSISALFECVIVDVVRRHDEDLAVTLFDVKLERRATIRDVGSPVASQFSMDYARIFFDFRMHKYDRALSAIESTRHRFPASEKALLSRLEIMCRHYQNDQAGLPNPYYRPFPSWVIYEDVPEVTATRNDDRASVDVIHAVAGQVRERETDGEQGDAVEREGSWNGTPALTGAFEDEGAKFRRELQITMKEMKSRRSVSNTPETRPLNLRLPSTTTTPLLENGSAPPQQDTPRATLCSPTLTGSSRALPCLHGSQNSTSLGSPSVQGNNNNNSADASRVQWHKFEGGAERVFGAADSNVFHLPTSPSLRGMSTRSMSPTTPGGNARSAAGSSHHRSVGAGKENSTAGKTPTDLPSFNGSNGGGSVHKSVDLGKGYSGGNSKSTSLSPGSTRVTSPQMRDENVETIDNPSLFNLTNNALMANASSQFGDWVPPSATRRSVALVPTAQTDANENSGAAEDSDHGEKASPSNGNFQISEELCSLAVQRMGSFVSTRSHSFVNGSIIQSIGFTVNEGNPKSASRVVMDNADNFPLEINAKNGITYMRSSRILGKGSFGCVCLGMDVHCGRLVAIKFLPMPSDEEEVGNVEREVLTMQRVKDNHLVEFVTYAFQNGLIVIIMECMMAGSLHNMISCFGAIPAATARVFIRDVLRGLHRLHSAGVIHRDVKPQNVLLSLTGHCKISDFGASAWLAELARKQVDGGGLEVQGTPVYLAPEAARGKPEAKSDIWSCGIMFIQLVTGKLPYSEELLKMSPPIVVFNIGSGSAFPKVPDSLEEFDLDFVNACLQNDPKERMTAIRLLELPMFAV